MDWVYSRGAQNAKIVFLFKNLMTASCLLRLNQAAHQLGLKISQAQGTAMLDYLDALLLWNKAYNLTAIKDKDEALVKHLFDAMTLIPHLPCVAHRLLDVGTGAGLPAVVIAILRPDVEVTALDCNQKKTRFVRQVKGELGIGNLSVIHTRIEQLDARFDVVTGRAFTNLGDFVRLCLPRLQASGKLLAMKGQDATDGQPLPKGARVIPLKVPELNDGRHLVILDTNF